MTAYQFSYQFFQLPYALVVVSIATALMPDLAERWSDGDRGGFERQFVAGLRVTLAVIVPVGLVYVAIAQPFIHVAVDHGRVTASGAHLVGSTPGPLRRRPARASAPSSCLMRLYQAMQNTRTMFWIYALENGLTVVAALVLDPILGVPGLALAWVGPYTIAALIAAYDLRRRVGSLGGTYTVRALARILLASGVTAGVVAAVGRAFPQHRQRCHPHWPPDRAARGGSGHLPDPGPAARNHGASSGHPPGSPPGSDALIGLRARPTPGEGEMLPTPR